MHPPRLAPVALTWITCLLVEDESEDEGTMKMKEVVFVVVEVLKLYLTGRLFVQITVVITPRL